MYVGKLDFEKAKNVYKKLEANATNLEAINIKLKIFKCYVQSEERDDAIKKRGAAIGQALTNQNLTEKEREEASTLILDFVKKDLLPQNFHKIALVLLSQVSEMCDQLPDSRKNLDQHMFCLEAIQGIARAMSRGQKKKRV